MLKLRRQQRSSRSPAGNGRGRAGFSLLELLVALFILALALIPIAYFYSETIRSVSLQQQRSRALMLAEERMNQVMALSYDQINANNEPSRDILINYVDDGNDQEDFDWEAANQNYNPFTGRVPAGSNPYPSEQALPPIFNFPLPYAQPNPNPASFEPDTVAFNPYDPSTQGYDLNNPNQEFEPIGFYSGLSRTPGDVRRTSPRANPIIDEAGNQQGLTAGTEAREEEFSIYGRRTIIMDVVPRVEDDDSDQFGPSHPRDGEDTTSVQARASRPNTVRSGPADKFTIESEFGNRGKLVVVQVFWLQDQQATGYVPKEDLYMVELKNFVPAQNTSGTTESFDFLNIGTGESLITTPTQP